MSSGFHVAFCFASTWQAEPALCGIVAFQRPPCHACLLQTCDLTPQETMHVTHVRQHAPWTAERPIAALQGKREASNWDVRSACLLQLHTGIGTVFPLGITAPILILPRVPWWPSPLRCHASSGGCIMTARIRDHGGVSAPSGPPFEGVRVLGSQWPGASSYASARSRSLASTPPPEPPI